MAPSVASCAVLFALSVACVSASRAINPNPEEYISITGGTANLGSSELSFGNVLPEVQTPWGFNGWAPTTALNSGSWWFDARASNLYGVRCTHQPSPWIGDYGQFRVMAQVVDPNHESVNQYVSYNPHTSSWSPYYWNASLLGYGTKEGTATIELTPTVHGALLRFTFPRPVAGAADVGYNATRRVLFVLGDPSKDALAFAPAGSDGLSTVTGSSRSNSGGVPANFAHYFHATLGGGEKGVTPVTAFSSAVSTADGTLSAYLDFLPTDTTTDTLVLRIATSLISHPQAAANHAREVAGVDFDAAVAAAKALWHEEATRARVVDIGPGYTPAQEDAYLTVFYSSLYRASKYPRAAWELDADNNPIHWSPYTGTTLPGVFSTDQGFWDAYRSTYSWLALHRPDRFALQMEGWLNAWREGGWVPQWSSPGYRGSMTGTMSDVSMSEAVVKLPHCGTARGAAAGYCVNASALYAASRQNAFVIPVGTPEGRSCLTEYLALGFVSVDSACDAVVSRTLNYLHGDWAIAQAAMVLGETADAATLLARSAKYALMLNNETGFFAPKTALGSFLPDFDEFAWGNGPGYTEAGPWQYRVEIPYDPQGLYATLKSIGFDGCDIIQTANTMPSTFHAGGYGNIIHEQAEMAVNCWAQWELNNQPVWALQITQSAFDTAINGTCAQQAQKWLRQSNSLFRPTADMFPGDEDNGSMGAWYIFNTLGLSPLSPASGMYHLGSPLFARVELAIDGAAGPLVISAVNQGPDNVYVSGVTWNGKAVTGVSVPYADLMLGGTLEFTMSPSMAKDSVARREL